MSNPPKDGVEGMLRAVESAIARNRSTVGSSADAAVAAIAKYLGTTPEGLARWRDNYSREAWKIEQALGQRLGFPWYKDDPVNFPDATESDGVCVGELVPEDLAILAADKLAALTEEVKALREALRLRDNDLGVVITALRFLEEAVGEDFDDDGGSVAEIERDWKARNLDDPDARSVLTEGGKTDLTVAPEGEKKHG